VYLLVFIELFSNFSLLCLMAKINRFYQVLRLYMYYFDFNLF